MPDNEGPHDAKQTDGYLIRFDPESAEFADVPLVHISADDKVELVRGQLPEWLEERRIVRFTPRSLEGTFGVLTNDLHDLELAEAGQLVEDVRVTTGVELDEMLRASSTEELLSVLDGCKALIEQARDAGFDVVACDYGKVQLRRTV